MLAPAARADEPLEPLRHAVAAVAQLRAQLAKPRRRVVTHVRAVLFDSAADRLADRLQPGVDRGRELRQERRLHRAAHAQRAFDRVRHLPERTCRENAASRRELRGLADVADPAQLRLERLVEERDRLGGQRLAPCHLGRIGRGRERPGELGASFGRRCGGDPLEDRRQLELVEREGVHDDECRAVSEGC